MSCIRWLRWHNHCPTVTIILGTAKKLKQIDNMATKMEVRKIIAAMGNIMLEHPVGVVGRCIPIFRQTHLTANLRYSTIKLDRSAIVFPSKCHKKKYIASSDQHFDTLHYSAAGHADILSGSMYSTATIFRHFSDIHSDILADVLSGIINGIYPGIYSHGFRHSILAFILTDSDSLSGIHVEKTVTDPHCIPRTQVEIVQYYQDQLST